MNTIKDLLKALPDMEHSFELAEVPGDVTGIRYSGNFRYRIPTNKQKALAERKRAELTGGLDDQMSTSVVQFIYKIAYLRATLIEYPEWWAKADYGYDLHDVSIVDEVYNKVILFENDWMSKVWGKKEIDGVAS